MPAVPSLASISRLLVDVLGPLPAELDGLAVIRDLPGWNPERHAEILTACDQRFSLRLNRQRLRQRASVADLLRACRGVRAEHLLARTPRRQARSAATPVKQPAGQR